MVEIDWKVKTGATITNFSIWTVILIINTFSDVFGGTTDEFRTVFKKRKALDEAFEIETNLRTENGIWISDAGNVVRKVVF